MSGGRDGAESGWEGSNFGAEAGIDYPAMASVRLGAVEPPLLSFNTESEAWRGVAGGASRNAGSKADAAAAAADSSSPPPPSLPPSAAEPGAIGRAAVMGVDAMAGEMNGGGGGNGGYGHHSHGMAFEVMEEEDVERVGGRGATGGGFLGLLGRIVGMFSKVASSGVEENYLYEPLAPGMFDELETGAEANGDSIAGQGGMPGLVPGMVGGRLRGQVIRPGRGVRALIGQEMSNGSGTFSTEVSAEDGCVTAAWAVSHAPESLIQGASAHEETAGGTEEDAVIRFAAEEGASSMAARLDLDGEGQRGRAGKAGTTTDSLDHVECRRARPWWGVRADTSVQAAFQLEAALPLGSVVVKLRRGTISVVGTYDTWQIIEMLTRFSIMLVLYALIIFLMYGFFFPAYRYELEVWSEAPKGLNFFTLSAQQRSNVSYFGLFFFLQLLTYIAILLLPQTLRVSMPTLLQELLPVTGHHISIGHARSDATSFSTSLANALMAGGVNVSTPKLRTHNAADRHAQTYASAKSSCFQVLVITPAFVSSPNVCLHLAAALQRPPHHSVCFVDPSLDWSKDGLGRPLPQGYAARLIQALRARGLRSVNTPRRLIQHIDRRMLGGALSSRGSLSSPEMCHLVSWWKSRPMAAPTREKDMSGGPSLTLSRPDSSIKIFGQRMHTNVYIRGSLMTPRGAYFSGRSFIGVAPNGTLKKGLVISVPFFGWLIMAAICAAAGFILLGPYSADTYTPWRYWWSGVSPCQMVGVEQEYNMGSPYEAAPPPSTTTECSGVYAGCCSECLSRGCIAFSVGQGSCSFVFPSEKMADRTTSNDQESLLAFRPRAGHVRGMPLTAADLGPCPPYISLLQIMALFVVTQVPRLIWRFFDSRLSHSAALVPIFMAAAEMRRLGASIKISGAGECATAMSLAWFLETCGVPMEPGPAGESVSEPDPNAAVFHIIILNSPHAAHKYKLSGWVSGGALAHASKRHMLLATKSVIQQVIAEVNDRSPLPLESSEFLQAFFEEFGTKLGFFLHSLDDPRDL